MAGRSDFKGIYAGGFQPFFRFRLNSQPRDGKILSSSSESDSPTQDLDATIIETTFTSAITGTQYKISSVIEYTANIGEEPVVEYSSNNEGIATVDAAGNVSYVSDGEVTITGQGSVSERSSASYSTGIKITMSSAGGEATVTQDTVPDPIDVSEHVLVIWNSNIADSTTCKNYYLANRPEFGTYGGGNTPNLLDCPCTTTGTSGFESITKSNFDSQIRTPILNWMESNPTKNIRYIILMYGMPSRVTDGNKHSVQYDIYRSLQETGARAGTEYRNTYDKFTLSQFKGATALVTSLNTANLANAQAYIDKLKSIYDGMASSNVVISASENNQGGSNYYFDDTGRIHSSKTGNSARLAVLEENPSANITYSGNPSDTDPVPDQTTNITSASDVTGYLSWGYNSSGFGGNYANDGSVTFSGNSNWYMIMTIESFNGRRSTFQENIQGWFSSTAFGGTSYANTPAFGVSHVEEPFLSGVNDRELFVMWESEDTSGPEYLAIEAAWSSRNTPYFQCVGDPLIKR